MMFTTSCSMPAHTTAVFEWLRRRTTNVASAYCEQFYELSGLLNGILEVMAYFSQEAARLEHQNMLTGEPIVFSQLTESEAA